MGDDHLRRCHKSVLEPYLGCFPNYAKPSFSDFHRDGDDFGVTLLQSESTIGIVIIPGITVPRESYYRILALK